ncbi:hypothetical protein [uncultured Croceitalea sp.]|uniref:hypothetical protein n=1 Tax=uncultured Croceitalea sp. TaxID=1798908 RepID=UPI003306211E
MKQIIQFSDFEKIKKIKILKVFYWFVRISMGFGFVLSGMRKLPGIRFTILSNDNPAGAFFNAMYDTGFYWNFIGYFQILLGILIFFNRFVVLTSVLMMPVTFNIFLVSIALNMKGTSIITSTMLMANIFLLIWNQKNYKNLFLKPLE